MIETPESLHAKVGKPYQREKILAFFLKQARVGGRTNIIRQIIPKCGSIKSKTVTVFWICVQIFNIEEPSRKIVPGQLYLMPYLP